MSVFQGLAKLGQRQAEALMESTCVITRATDAILNDDGSVSTTPDTIYTGQCRLRYPFVRPQQVSVASQVLEKARGILSLPISDPTTANVRTNDVVTITGNPSDPDGVVGQQWIVLGPFTETHATSRRLPVEAIS